jgi:hypothetical protein
MSLDELEMFYVDIPRIKAKPTERMTHEELADFCASEMSRAVMGDSFADRANDSFSFAQIYMEMSRASLQNARRCIKRTP